jgi:hypothetical protein
MLVSKKSFTGYVVFFLYPTLLVLTQGVTDWRARLAFALGFNLLLVVEPSLWFHFGGEGVPLSVWLHRSSATTTSIFIAIDLALVSCYALLAVIAGRCARIPEDDPHPVSLAGTRLDSPL